VVRNGPDLENIKAKNPNYEIKNGFKYLIGYVGVIGQQEGIENLLKSVEYIVKVKKITDILFVVIGKGPAWKQVTQQCTSMGLDGNIRFTGFIPDQELWDILAATDACVNPEFGNEFTDRSTMIKIMEYMTFGNPSSCSTRPKAKCPLEGPRFMSAPIPKLSSLRPYSACLMIPTKE